MRKGYKAYRKYVNSRLNNLKLKNRFVVLHGLTGVGKTSLLKKIETLGVPVLDLEGLAGHRGSVFGAVGLDTPASQKNFDAHLLVCLEKLDNKAWVVVEGEGRRIGNVYLPNFLYEAMREGCQVLLTAPLETRVERILNTYSPELLTEKGLKDLKKAFDSLRSRLGNKKVDTLLLQIDQGKYRSVVEVLCTDYYDRLYSDSRPESAHFDHQVDACEHENAAEVIKNLIANLK